MTFILLCDQAICKTLKKLSNNDMTTFKTLLWKRYPRSVTTPPQSTDLVDLVDLVDRLLERCSLAASLQITKALLQEIGQNKLADYLQSLCVKSKSLLVCIIESITI